MLVASTLLVVLLAQGGVSLVSPDIFSSCLSAPLTLIPDPEDCHIFYQCDINQQPMSCGNMMFNSYRQVCDWPSTVLQLRPECRQEEKLRFSNTDYPYHRTLRMLRYFGDGDQFSQKRLRAPQDVGLGREKNFGNRDYNLQNLNNHIDEVEHENGNEKTMNMEEIKEDARSFTPDIASGLQFDIKSQVLQEIRRRLPQIVKNNIPSLSHAQEPNKEVIETKQENKQTKPASTPADTIRLSLHPISLNQPGQPIERPKPTSFINLKSTPSKQPVVDDNDNSVEKEELKTPSKQQAESTPADTVRLLSVQGPGYAYGQEYPAIQQSQEYPAKQQSQEYPAKQQSQEIKEEPQPAPILVEDTREFKPVWTVTRERPRQILLRYRNMKHTPCAEKNCPQRRQRVLRKIKRKLITGEKHQLEQRRKELILGTAAAQNTIANEEEVTMDERKAITLKEAYDRAINKVDQSQHSRPVPGNLLHEILNRDYGLKSNEEYDTHSYVSSDQLRAEVPGDMNTEE